MKKILEKYYPLYIGLLVGIPIWSITYFAMDKKWHDVFWFMMLIYVAFIIIQQFNWSKK
jgi:hypothetical protein